ncbi:MAG: NRDE family protein, partial [Acidimicrobiales bacterium]
MCTVLLRFSPGSPWPVVAGAVRDEFTERPWDPPDRHWDGPRSALVGGRDHTAGGTWLAVDPQRPALAALLN